MASASLRKFSQISPYASPWAFKAKLRLLAWELVRLSLFRFTPKPLYPWRVWLLRRFGAKVSGKPYVAASARIKMPWNLTLEDRACIGPEADIYNLDQVVLHARCTIAQQAYLCGGSHDFNDPALPLLTGAIVIGADAFVGARAFILPGVRVGNAALVGACAVVSRDVEAYAVVAGNPARLIRKRGGSNNGLAGAGACRKL